ncbi:MAG: crossover junction endodeoxyribonuclease RuvC [Deltaproteobacteria bacterium]|nr:crossover junction endodeoxyribonuclease RuvC [Deltaproteobacteria bacterium]
MTLHRTIGIDPGSRFTGYGVVEGDGSRLRYLANGVIRLRSQLSFPERLRCIYEQLMDVIGGFAPLSMAVEDVFVAKNPRTALLLGQARGAAILAGVNSGLAVFEYSALQIKQAVVGYGRADKAQVQNMVQNLFFMGEPLNPNAADALAVAVCHLNTNASMARWNRSEPK